jgi:hypothetical protein
LYVASFALPGLVRRHPAERLRVRLRHADRLLMLRLAAPGLRGMSDLLRLVRVVLPHQLRVHVLLLLLLL